MISHPQYSVILVAVSNVETRLLVHTGVGSIQGVPADDGNYAMFLGIPYAKVNTSNPFGASLPYEKFDKVFEAFTESAACPQIAEVFLESEGDPYYYGALDCLNLNVYVPNTDTKDKAVYLYVYGGLYRYGHSERTLYGPKYLVRHDIIVVTFNYRSGAYGFMCTDIPEIPGNQGLRDQYNANKWVRDNIRAFGGDPDKITIGGHSSGSILASLHLLNKQPRLFQQAILQSGMAANTNIIIRPDTTVLVKIANDLGFETNDTYAALSFLAKVSPETIINATDTVDVWKPCVEKQFNGISPFIGELPESSEGANIEGLNILGGFTDNECLHWLFRPIFYSTFDRPDLIRHEFDLKFNLAKDSKVPDIFTHFYFKDDGDRETYKSNVVDFYSDHYFVYPIQRRLLKYTQHRNTSVYMYMFSYDGHLNRLKQLLYNVTKPGATHSDELGYIFTMYFLPDAPNDDDQRMIDRLTTLWTNFIKYGNPTPVSTELVPVSWPRLTADTVPCLQIDTNLTVITRPFRKNMALWDLFFETLGDNTTIIRD